MALTQTANSPFARQDSSEISLRDAYVAQGETPRQANHFAVRESLEILLQRSRAAMIWVYLSFAILLGFAGLLGWSWTVYAKHADDECDQPLWKVVWLLWVTGCLTGFKKEIAKCLCCYDSARDGPARPRRVRLLRTATVISAVLWPVIALVFLSQTRNCSDVLQNVVRVLAFYYLAGGFVIVVLPTLAVTLVLCLVRRGWVRIRSEGEAPDGFIDQLEVIDFDAAEFDDTDDKWSSDCPICLDPFTTERRIIRTPCTGTTRGHVFHRSCLDNWLHLQRTCPLCRTDLVEARIQA